MHDFDKRRALVIGGSLGGLFAGNLLRRSGWDVDIFERCAHDLDSRGGGIVLQPEVVEVLRRAGANIQAVDLGVRSQYRTVFRPDGSIRSKRLAPQIQTSWSRIYTSLKTAFGLIAKCCVFRENCFLDRGSDMREATRLVGGIGGTTWQAEKVRNRQVDG
jgi:hypothetical protein